MGVIGGAEGRGGEGSRVRGVRNWLMESVGVWVVGQGALVQLGFCLRVHMGAWGHLVFLCLGGPGGSAR